MNGPVQSVPKSESLHTGISFADAGSAPERWKTLTEASADAWFWHTWANLQFNLVAAQKYEARNLSFFVLANEEIVGVVPLVVNRIQMGDISALEASYYGAPLPWPAFLPDLAGLETIEDVAFVELQARARVAGAERIRLRLEPPFPTNYERRRLDRILRQHQYLDSSYVSHWMLLEGDPLTNVRERYRRYVKKFSPGYSMSIAHGDGITTALEETYFRLHVKDAGGQFRSRESYSFQADLARKGEAFFVIARNRSSDTIVGMLLVSIFKDAAYDNSVAVDPDFQHEYVSHLLKWFAIEELLRRGARSYELGPKAEGPCFMSLSSEKARGISYFKEGWARESVRRVGVAEKFLSSRLLHAFMRNQADSLEEYFRLR